MSRYLMELAYEGSGYAGWQRQPNALSVEEVVDTTLSTVLRQQTKIVGCGRTDAGVHASQYFAHFDHEEELPERLAGRLDRMLPPSIVIRGISPVSDDFHARFSATERGYVYRIARRKDPFRPTTVTVFPHFDRVDRERMQEVAGLLPNYDSFETFQKTNSDAYTAKCSIKESYWEFGEDEWAYHIRANRFLRGMVRLIVGACLRAGRGLLDPEDVNTALSKKIPLNKPFSAPADGLFLNLVNYSELKK